jgi:hypothetical protein
MLADGHGGPSGYLTSPVNRREKKPVLGADFFARLDA